MPAQFYIDGIEVTNIVLDGSAKRRLNRSAQATVRVPIDAAPGQVGSRLKVVFDGDLFFHGMILAIEDQMDEDFGYTTYNATDPMELWQWRPARDGPDGTDPGDFSNPLFFTEFITGPQIMEQILLQSIDDSDPGLGEGPLFIELGTFESGGVNLSGAPTDWPMSIAEVSTLLTDTGEVDIVLSPIDTGGNMARVDIYNGDYGVNRTGSVFFDFATDNKNVRSVRQMSDMSQMCNKLWYYGGPRVLTADDPGGVQHWCFNIQGDDTGLPGFPSSPPYSTVIDIREDSQATFGVRMEVKIFDARGENCSDAITDAERMLYRRLWLLEQYLRSQPRRMVHIQPARVSDNMQLPPGVNLVQVGDFDIGDLVTVRAGASFRGGFSGAQRIYEYTVTWDSEGVYEIGELVTSPNQEGV